MRLIKNKYHLYLKKSKNRGWGVFCKQKILKGRVIETSPIILIPKKHLHKFSNTAIDSYRFTYWGDTTAIVLGYSSLYNHSKNANCAWRVNRKSQTFTFYATENIPANTEILHDYGWDKHDYKKRGF